MDVTPETVQSIVATLIRPDSYYRELTVETLWSGGSCLLLRPVLAGPGLVPHPSGFGLRRGAP
ncbi:MAG: hypothetical protein ACLUJG_11610 [Lawsonibacter sp.]